MGASFSQWRSRRRACESMGPCHHKQKAREVIGPCRHKPAPPAAGISPLVRQDLEGFPIKMKRLSVIVVTNNDGPPLAKQLVRAYHRRQLDLFKKTLSQGVDPDARCPRTGATLLYHACTDCFRDDYARALLHAGADPNLEAPAVAAARAENFSALELIIVQPTFDVNATLADGGSILHFLLRMPCKMRNTEKLLRCIEHVLNRVEVQVNRPDSFGKTPIMYAVEMYQEDRVQVMLKQTKHKLNLDVLQPNLGRTIREFIVKRFCDLKHYLPPQVIEDLDSKDPHIRLLAALQHRRLDVFKLILQERDSAGDPIVNPDFWHGDPYYCTCLELACRINGCEEFVKALLDAGADPTAVSKMDGTPLVHFVLDCCNYSTLQVLLQDGRLDVSKSSYMNVTALHMAAVQKNDNPEANERGRQCVELLLNFQQQNCAHGDPAVAIGGGSFIDINVKDGNGDTPLHYAAQYGCKEVVLTLLRRGANMMARNNHHQPPVHFMSAQILEEFLDDQVDSNEYSSRTGCYTLIFKYAFLQHNEPGVGYINEMDPLLSLTQPHLRRLLQHPVISSYLYLKWTRVRIFFYMDIFFYVVFVISLTAFILLNDTHHTRPKHPPEVPALNISENETINDRKNQTAVLSDQITSKIFSFFAEDEKHAMKAWLLVVIFFFGYVLSEIFHMFILRWQYFKIWSNYMSLVVITVTGIVITHQFIDDVVYKHLCAIAILIAWIDLVLISGRLPAWSIHLEMLKKVNTTFLHFMSWYFLLIIAFALCFHTLFHKFKPVNDSVTDEELTFFDYPVLSVVKTVAMFAGELSIGSLPLTYVPGTSHLIFVIFVMLIAIVLLNLLNGLAVYDTQAIKENARVLSLVALVRVVASIERTLLDLRRSSLSKYSKILRCLPDPRIYQDNVCCYRKQIQVFPNEGGKIKFYMDIDTTNRFKRFRMDEPIIKSAIEIITKRRKRTDVEEIKSMFQQVDEKLKNVEAVQEKLMHSLDRIALLLEQGSPPPSFGENESQC